jgi:hypothetical protein
MSRSQRVCVWLGLMAATVFLGLGCAASVPASRQSPEEYVPAEIQPGPGESIVSKSTLDRGNRYVAAVLVDGGEGTCGGVVIAPRVVLTAGHCVCSQREVRSGEARGQTLIDRTTCARSATIEVLSYRSEEEPDKESFTGTVSPHEHLHILYDEQGREVSSNADLAVIFLSAPLKSVKPIRLATTQLQYRQLVTLVGYGATMIGGRGGGRRRFGSMEPSGSNVTRASRGARQRGIPTGKVISGRLLTRSRVSRRVEPHSWSASPSRSGSPTSPRRCS